MTNFTPHAQQALTLARQEAARFNHNFVGTEHVLLGLIRLGQGAAVNVLKRMGLDLEAVRGELEKQVGTGPEQKIVGYIPYTPRVKKGLVLAAKEAAALHHAYVGTEHILLGLLREGDGVAARVLKSLGVNIEKTREEVLRELDPNFEPMTDDTGAAEKTPKADLLKPPDDTLDLSKRYDVYCVERNQELVVYRNVLFKGRKRLFQDQRGQYDIFYEFLELEQADGSRFFIARSSVVRFCEHGLALGAEVISGKKL